MTSNDVTTSMLTDRQRQWLKGEVELESGAERALRSRMRNRLRQTFQDMELVYEALPQRDKDYFRTNHEEELKTGVSSMTALGYKLLSSNEWTRAAEHGLYKAAREKDPNIYSVTIESEFRHKEPSVDFSAAKGKYEEEGVDALSDQELGVLLEQGEISRDDL